MTETLASCPQCGHRLFIFEAFKKNEVELKTADDRDAIFYDRQKEDLIDRIKRKVLHDDYWKALLKEVKRITGEKNPSVRLYVYNATSKEVHELRVKAGMPEASL